MKLPRLYPILDTGLFEKRQFPLLEAARVYLESGIELLQWRCKTLIGRAQLEEVDELVTLCQRHRATLIVNDRADLALMAGAHGVHVGQEDLPAALVRKVVGPECTLGLSTHNRQQFEEGLRQPVNYLALGPIFATGNKENPDPVVGLDELNYCAGATRLPVVAIGGITRANARQVFATGAASVAVIGDLIPEDCDTGALRERLHDWMRVL